MEKKVYSSDGKDAGQISLKDDVFGVKISQGAIYEAIKSELANLRQGTAQTKNRSAVRGSNRKPWRQKGTGNARVGDKASPIWRSGGVVFGPQNRDYGYSIPKKLKRLAFRSTLTLKAQDDEKFKVIKEISVESGKTKELAKMLDGLGISSKRGVLIYSENDSLLKRAGSNIPNLTLLSSDRLRVHDLFYCETLFVLQSAAERLNQLYGTEA